MKSTDKQLQGRGKATREDILKYSRLSNCELLENLSSDDAVVRTSSVHLLSKRFPIHEKQFVNILLKQLKNENALYTRLEICEVLKDGNAMTAKMMFPYLCKIKSKQYKKVPEKGSSKISYPLPRDIIARTLGKMNPYIIKDMLALLDIRDKSKVSELLDAIGYMIFYNPELATYPNFKKISNFIYNNKKSELLLWKSITCLSAFPIPESIELLKELDYEGYSKPIQDEIKRSLKIIKLRKDK